MQQILYPGRRRIAVWTAVLAFGMLLGGGLLSVLCGLGALAFAGSLLPGAAWLAIDGEGFTVCHWYRKQRYRWADIETFQVVTHRALFFIPVNRTVSFRFTEAARKQRGVATRMAGAVNRFDIMLPDNYGMDARVFAKSMDTLRRQALELPPISEAA